MNGIDKEIDNYNLQIVASLLFVVSIFISIFLTYSEELRVFNRDAFSRSFLNKVNIFNRIFALGILCVFLYSSFVTRDIAIDKGYDLEEHNFRIFINLITLVPAFLTLYVAVKYQDEDIDFGESPL